MAKKMPLMDIRVVDALKQKQYVPPDTLNDNLRELDRQMQHIMDQPDISDRDKARVYQQTLQRYMNRLDQYRHKPLGIVDFKQDMPTAPIQPVESTIHKQENPVIPPVIPLQSPTSKKKKKSTSRQSPYHTRTKLSSVPKVTKWEAWPKGK